MSTSIRVITPIRTDHSMPSQGKTPANRITRSVAKWSQTQSDQIRSGQVRSGQVRSGQVSIRLAHITDNTLRPPPNPVKSSAVDRATPVFQTPHQRLLKAGSLKSTAAMLFGSGQAQAGRIRVLAAGLRLRRDARGLLFESDACTWSGDQVPGEFRPRP